MKGWRDYNSFKNHLETCIQDRPNTESSSLDDKYFITATPDQIIYIDEARSSLAVILDIGLLICTLCRQGIEVIGGHCPGQAHLRNHHSEQLQNYDSSKVIEAINKAEDQILNLPARMIIPEIAIVPGHQCLKCNRFCCVQRKLLRSHEKDCSGEVAMDPTQLQSDCFVQRLYNDSRSPYFVVDYHPISQLASGEKELRYLDHVTKDIERLSNGSASLPETSYQFECDLSKKLGLLSKKEDVGMETIQVLFSKRPLNDCLYTLLRDFFLPRLKANFRISSHEVRSRIGSNARGVFLGKAFTLPLLSSSLDAHIKFIHEFVMFLFQVHGNPIVTDSLEKSLASLIGMSWSSNFNRTLEDFKNCLEDDSVPEQLDRYLDLFREIIQTQFPLKGSDWMALPFSFICLKEISRNQVLSPADFTTAISHAKFMLRSAALVLVERESDEEKILFLLEYLNDYPHTNPTTMSRLVAFSGLMRQTVAAQKNSSMIEKVHVISEHSTNGIELMIENARFHMNSFTSAIHGMVEKLKNAIADLLYGCSTVDIAEMLQKIGSETIIDQRIGICFVQHILKARVNVVPKLLIHFSKINSIREWKDLDRYLFLEKASSILKLLLVLFHITGGAPPRGTEVLQLRLSNDQFMARSFYVHQGSISILYVYNKTGDRPIRRYLPKSIAELLVVYLVLLRPVEIFFAQMLGLYPGNAPHPPHFAYLFLAKRLMTAEEYRLLFAKTFQLQGRFLDT